MFMTKYKKDKDTYSYKGWLVSDDLIKRSFAVLGHYLFAGLILWGVLFIIFLIFLFIGLILGV